MKTTSVAKSIEMFKAVLDGRTYEAVAQSAGLTRSAVEQRVKALARDLQTIVGVEGVDDHDLLTIASLRAAKHSYLEALDHYQPERAGQRRRNGTVSEQEIDLLVERTRLTSNCSHRDVALLLTLFATGAKPLEIARLEVRDYLYENGSVREDSVLRADVAVNGRARPLYFASAKANAAIDAYLAERVRRGQGVARHPRYRGLDPASKLFLTDDGKPMPIKLRQNGKQRHYLCSVILDIYRKLFARAGLRGVSALSARRTVAHKLKARGADDADIGRILGLTEKDSIRNLLPNQPKPLRAAVRELV